MRKVRLKSGLEIIYLPKKGASVTIQVMVGIGSAIERRDEWGLAHFLEHILFEGTASRPHSFLIANEIEKRGGQFNAYTNQERTCYYAKVPRQHFIPALDVLSDIVQHPLFLKDSIEKEKKVVLKEIDMVYDDPHSYQWVLLQQKLYPKCQQWHPTYGDRGVIARLTRSQIKTFFDRYYHPRNMVICVAGQARGWRSEIEARFDPKSGANPHPKKCPLNPIERNVATRKNKDISSSHVMFGYRAVNRNHPDSYVLDVIDAILGRGQSGKMFQSVRAEHGLAYEVGTQYVSEGTYGHFSVYAVVDPLKRTKAERVMLEQLDNLQKISRKEVEEAKGSLEGEFRLDMEDTQKIADLALFWNQIGSLDLLRGYIPRIKKVTVEDVRLAARRFLRNYVKVVIEKKAGKSAKPNR